jgi:hypothetical protein
MKYSKEFERDYNFYLSNIDNFTVCGTKLKYEAIPDENGKTAKETFFYIDSSGKNLPCREPDLLNQLLLCKASVNFMIKQWADGVWQNIWFPSDIQEVMECYHCPEWVKIAIENQYQKLLREKGNGSVWLI